jgi:hypothetical protein
MIAIPLGLPLAVRRVGWMILIRLGAMREKNA